MVPPPKIKGIQNGRLWPGSKLNYLTFLAIFRLLHGFYAKEFSFGGFVKFKFFVFVKRLFCLKRVNFTLKFDICAPFAAVKQTFCYVMRRNYFQDFTPM